MHNNIIPMPLRQEHYFIVQIEITFFRTTPPSRLLVLNKNFIERKSIRLIKELDPLVRQNTRPLFIREIIFARKCSNRFSVGVLEKPYFVQDTLSFFSKKLLNGRPSHALWNRNNDASIVMHRKTRPFRPLAPL